MTVVAYLTNQFPNLVEPYVVDEIRELRQRGIEVISCSARHADPSLDDCLRPFAAETLYLQPLEFALLMRAAWLCFIKLPLLFDLVERVIVMGSESPARRWKALLHTWLGAYYALRLEGLGVEHIHIHHGYFASWVAMVAARLRGISFSFTLHGSDVLLHPEYLETKLKHCKFCATISEFNRRHILEQYPQIDPGKVVVQRMGVDPHCTADFASYADGKSGHLVMLAVGRLHPVKDHAFLVRACRRLKDQGIRFVCSIAGEGPERRGLEGLIGNLDLRSEIQLLGHCSQQQLDAWYATCDLVVLTSRSEGIPLVLMEAMARGKTVLAPAITGIPELVLDGQTGFLYRAGSLADFAAQVGVVVNSRSGLGPLRKAARQHVLNLFNREKNLPAFVDLLLSRIADVMEKDANENPVLQQI